MCLHHGGRGFDVVHTQRRNHKLVSLKRRRIAVVLFNLGGPDGPDAVRPFLFNLFRDPAIISVH